MADIFLKLQFIRGLRYMDIELKLLQGCENRTFQDIVNLASAVE